MSSDDEPRGDDPTGLLQFVVEGTSMWPALRPGMRVEVAAPDQCHRHKVKWPPPEGAIVVARHPFRPQLIIKRVVESDGTGLVLRGDDWIESEDSGSLGRFALDSIVGVVLGHGESRLGGR